MSENIMPDATSSEEYVKTLIENSRKRCERPETTNTIDSVMRRGEELREQREGADAHRNNHQLD